MDKLIGRLTSFEPTSAEEHWGRSRYLYDRRALTIDKRPLLELERSHRYPSEHAVCYLDFGDYEPMFTGTEGEKTGILAAQACEEKALKWAVAARVRTLVVAILLTGAAVTRVTGYELPLIGGPLTTRRWGVILGAATEDPRLWIAALAHTYWVHGLVKGAFYLTARGGTTFVFTFAAVQTCFAQARHHLYRGLERRQNWSMNYRRSWIGLGQDFTDRLDHAIANCRHGLDDLAKQAEALAHKSVALKQVYGLNSGPFEAHVESICQRVLYFRDMESVHVETLQKVYGEYQGGAIPRTLDERRLKAEGKYGKETVADLTNFLADVAGATGGNVEVKRAYKRLLEDNALKERLLSSLGKQADQLDRLREELERALPPNSGGAGRPTSVKALKSVSRAIILYENLLNYPPSRDVKAKWQGPLERLAALLKEPLHQTGGEYTLLTAYRTVCSLLWRVDSDRLEEYYLLARYHRRCDAELLELTYGLLPLDAFCERVEQRLANVNTQRTLDVYHYLKSLHFVPQKRLKEAYMAYSTAPNPQLEKLKSGEGLKEAKAITELCVQGTMRAYNALSKVRRNLAEPKILRPLDKSPACQALAHLNCFEAWTASLRNFYSSPDTSDTSDTFTMQVQEKGSKIYLHELVTQLEESVKAVQGVVGGANVSKAYLELTRNFEKDFICDYLGAEGDDQKKAVWAAYLHYRRALPSGEEDRSN